VRRFATGVAVAAAVLLAVPLAARAETGDLYWANTAGGTLNGTIGHAKLDGTHHNEGYVKTFDVPCGVAVDSKHLYWADASGTTVGKVSLAHRKNLNYGFLTGASSPCGVGLGGGRVFTANQGTPHGLLSGSLDGGKLKIAHSDEPTDASYVTDSDCGVATDSKHVYWLVNGYNNTRHLPYYAIERMPFGGKPSTAKVIGGRETYSACGIDVAGGYMYVTENSGGFNAINRFPLTDKPPTPYAYIELINGNHPCGVAVTRKHIYWADAEANSIGRANIDGTHVKPEFITGASVPCGIDAVAR
jgi:hypothetical protein